MSAIDDCVSAFLSEEVPKGREPTKQEIAIGFSKCREKRARQAMLSLRFKFASNSVISKLSRKKKARSRYASLDTDFRFPDDQTGKYAAYFLLAGDETNGNHWGVTEQSIEKNIQSFVGKPFVVTAKSFHAASIYGDNFLHPNIGHFKDRSPQIVAGLDPENFDDILSFQKQFKVGEISKVIFDDTDHNWKAIIKLSPQFEGQQLPPFCSPALFQDDMSEPDNAMTQWRALHLAGLMDQPAYGSQALFKGTCTDTLGACTKSFVNNTSLLKTEIKLAKKEFQAGIISTDNPQVNVVPIFKKKRKKLS